MDIMKAKDLLTSIYFVLDGDLNKKPNKKKENELLKILQGINTENLNTNAIQLIDNKVIVGGCWNLLEYNSLEVEENFENKKVEYTKIVSEDGGDHIIKAKLTNGGCFYYRISKHLYENTLIYKI